MKSRWITHKGRQIMLADYSDFGRDFDSLRAEIDAADEVIEVRPEHSVLCLVDVRGTIASHETVDYMKKSSARTEDQIEKMAVVGIYGVRKVIFDAFVRITRQPMRAFNDVEAAKEWLVKG